MALHIPGVSEENVAELVRRIILTFEPRMGRMENTTIIMNTVIILLLILILMFTVVVSTQTIMERRKGKSKPEDISLAEKTAKYAYFKQTSDANGGTFAYRNQAYSRTDADCEERPHQRQNKYNTISYNHKNMEQDCCCKDRTLDKYCCGNNSDPTDMYCMDSSGGMSCPKKAGEEGSSDPKEKETRH